MKKTLIIITAITLLFTACNADATSGLFRTATQAREAINIKYEQILGIDAGTLYFRTSKGIYSQENSNKQPTLLVASKEGNIIKSATLLIDDDRLVYKTDKNHGSLFNYNLVTHIVTPINLPSVPITDFRLMPNGKVVFIKEGNAGKFWVADLGNLNTEVATENLVSDLGLAGLFTPSNYKDPTDNSEFLLSFVKSSEYKNFYFDGADLEEVTGLTEAIANFAIVDSKIFVLTVNGKLYYYASSPYTSPTLLAESSSDFGRDGMFYPIDDGTDIHFITNPLYSDSMTIFTVDTNDPNKTSVNKTTNGFAVALKDTHIVSSLKLDTNKFLVATANHGMYSVSVNPSTVPDGGGTVSPAEGYTF